MQEWQQDLATGICALQTSGRLPLDLDVEQREASLLAAIQGGVVIMQATGSIDHLRAGLDHAIDDMRRLDETDEGEI